MHEETPEQPAPENGGEAAPESGGESQPESESKAAPAAGSVSYFQGRPVFVGSVDGDSATVYGLPAPQTVAVDSLTETAEEYDAGAEAEAATTAETATVSSQSV